MGGLLAMSATPEREAMGDAESATYFKKALVD